MSISVWEIDKMQEWLLANMNHSDVRHCDISTHTGMIDVTGDLNMQNKEMDRLPFKIGQVTGDCWFTGSHFIDLENSPEAVGKSFGAYDCSRLVSLVGCPKTVGRNLYIMRNFHMTSLRGVSQYVGGDVNVTGAVRLLPSEMRYLLLSDVRGQVLCGDPNYPEIKYKLQGLLQDGRIGGKMPSELIPEKIRQLKEMDATWRT